MEFAVYIRDPEQFLKGEIDFSISIVTAEKYRRWQEKDLPYGGELIAVVDIPVDAINRELLTKRAVAALDKHIEVVRAEAQAEVVAMERRKSELLAITYQPREE